MSPVVHLSQPEPGIAVVRLEDRRHRNGFSAEFVEGLIEAMSGIEAFEPPVRVVVVHGYDRIFSAGGTREELLALQAGRKDFTDLGFYRMLLDCGVPVIAAMQGHAIGGGLVFGLYADVAILAEECLYSANFMSYGFTPGMGGTLVLPEKLGANLAAEMLYSARSFHGGELLKRGAPARIVPADQVIQVAMELARELAEKPHNALRLLKETLTQRLRRELPAVIERELEMHRQTFHAPEVRRRIESIVAD